MNYYPPHQSQSPSVPSCYASLFPQSANTQLPMSNFPPSGQNIDSGRGQKRKFAPFTQQGFVRPPHPYPPVQNQNSLSPSPRPFNPNYRKRQNPNSNPRREPPTFSSQPFFKPSFLEDPWKDLIVNLPDVESQDAMKIIDTNEVSSALLSETNKDSGSNLQHASKEKKDFKSCSVKELTTLLKDKGIEFSDCLDKESLVERCTANSHLWDNELLSSTSSSSSSLNSSLNSSSSSFYYSSSSSSSSANSFRPMFNLPPPKHSTTTNMTLDLDHFSSTSSNSLQQSLPSVKNSGVMTIDFDDTSSTSFSTSQPISLVGDKYDEDDNNLNEERIIFANSNEGRLNQVIQKRPKLLFNLPPPKYT